MADNNDDITLKTADIHMTKLNVLDTLNVYFRCQKYMYDQSSKITLFKHNCISGITISITSGICIFISFLETYQWRTVIIIVLNAIVSVLLLLSKYWKLETTSELYLYISRQFELISDNIEHMKSYNGGAIQMHTKVRELEKRVIETRDIPNITFTTYIQAIYPV